MARVIFSIPPRPASNKLPNGEVAPGIVWFEATLYEPGEGTGLPGGGPGGLLVSDLLAAIKPGVPFRVAPSPFYVGTVPEAVLPLSLLQSLPPTSRLVATWHWTRKEG